MRITVRTSLLVLAVLACTVTTLEAQILKTQKKPNEISLEEIEASPPTNVYDLVRALRPQWLKPIANQTIRTKHVLTTDARGGLGVAQVIDEPQIIVYLENNRYGTLESLRDISTQLVGSVEFVTPAKANMRWGAGHLHGAVVVNRRIE